MWEATADAPVSREVCRADFPLPRRAGRNRSLLTPRPYEFNRISRLRRSPPTDRTIHAHFRVAFAACCRGPAYSLPAHAQYAIGVVLMHGKQSAPGEHDDLAGALASAGYVVERPEMCWSNRRIYDLPYLDCLREIRRRSHG